MDTISGIIGGILGTVSGFAVVFLFFVGFRKISSKNIPRKEDQNVAESKKIIVKNISVKPHDQIREKQVYDIDLSAGEKTARVVIHAIPRPQQLFIKEYGIRVDGSDLIKISNNCDAIFTLDEGTHALEICSLANKLKEIYGDTVGKPSKIQISVGEQKTMEFEYTGPYWMWMAGKLRKSVEK